MHDGFPAVRQRMEAALANFTLPEGPPFPFDQWIISSLMHKAIRRGEVETAQRAALRYVDQCGPAIWRRLLVIAFEDVGIASPDALVQTAATCLDPAWRTAQGGHARVAAYLAGLLAVSPKDRSADYLICAAHHHLRLEEARDLCGSRPFPERLALVADASLPLEVRAVAAWYASGLEWGEEKRVGPGDLPGP